MGDELAAARLWAVNEAPYFATALFASVPILIPGLGTMASDRHWRMYIDPELTENQKGPHKPCRVVHRFLAVENLALDHRQVDLPPD